MDQNRNAIDGALADRVWRGYDPRAAAPLIAIAVAGSAILLAGRWYLGDLTAALVPYAIVLALWPGLLGLALYRATTYTYRITDRALLVDRGFRNFPESPIRLKEITAVDYGASWLGKHLGIGWVKVSADGRELLLTALRHPAEFATILKGLIAKAKA